MNVQAFRTRTGALLRRVGNWIVRVTETSPFRSCLVLGTTVNLLLYLLHGRSPVDGLLLVLRHPLYFLFNTLLVVATYVLTLFGKKRIFSFSLVTVVWLALGVTNCVLLGMRNDPLCGIDFYIVRNGIVLWPTYMGVLGIVATLLGVLGALALLVLLYFKTPAVTPNLSRTLLTVLCYLVGLLLATLCVVGPINADPQRFDDPKEAADVYGFPYCFLRSVFERGIPKPDNYSEDELHALVAELAAMESATPRRTPNVIFVQLESLFDVSRIEGAVLSEDPLPNLRALRQRGSHGFLSVPCFGGGTANTEFEVLTGLDLTLFGTGEYPYQSVLGDRCCETVAYGLSALGYTAHGMHNHTGTFYDRHLVYANLGFDTFTSVEHMSGVTHTPLGWEKDAILTDYVLKALTSTEWQDFVFAVSVQGHGGYPDLPMESEEAAISAYHPEKSEEWNNAFSYYVNQIHEMDAFVGALTDALTALGEDTVLVLYGDHLPALELTEDDLATGSLFETEYVVWSSFPLTPKERDLEAYQLSSEILAQLGIEGGLINRIHQLHTLDGNYTDLLALAGYDMLYGDGFAFGGSIPYQKRIMKMGLDPFAIQELTESASGEFLVEGCGFTPFSQVFVNGRRTDTEFVSEVCLLLPRYQPEEGDLLTVIQVSVDQRKLAQTETYTVSLP